MFRKNFRLVICSILLVVLCVGVVAGCKKEENNNAQKTVTETEKESDDKKTQDTNEEQQTTISLKYDYKINQVDTRLMFDDVIENDSVDSLNKIKIKPTIKSEYEEYFIGWNIVAHYGQESVVKNAVLTPKFDETQIGFYMCESGSMLPTLVVSNGYMYLKQSEYQVDDIVVWASTWSNNIFAHRVVEIDASDAEVVKYITKGDNNPNKDGGYITNDIILGKIIKCIDDFSKTKEDVEKRPASEINIKDLVWINSKTKSSFQGKIVPSAVCKCQASVKGSESISSALFRVKLSFTIDTLELELNERINVVITYANNTTKQTQLVKFGEYWYLMNDSSVDNENEKMYSLDVTGGDVTIAYAICIPASLTNSLASEYKLNIQIISECIQSEIYDSNGKLVETTPANTKALFDGV